jgi:hypothetical protein
MSGKSGKRGMFWPGFGSGDPFLGRLARAGFPGTRQRLHLDLVGILIVAGGNGLPVSNPLGQ